MKWNKTAVWPIAGVTMAAGAAIGMSVIPRRKRAAVQKAAAKALRAVGEAVENFPANAFRM